MGHSGDSKIPVGLKKEPPHSKEVKKEKVTTLALVFHASVLLYIDHEFRHHIVKEAVGDSRVDLQKNTRKRERYT